MTPYEVKGMSDLVAELVTSCADNLAINHVEGHDLPDKESVAAILDTLLSILFPGYREGKAVPRANLANYFYDRASQVGDQLWRLAERAFSYGCRIRQKPAEECRACDRAGRAVERLLQSLPALRKILKEDMAAAFERDPAAVSHDEILFCYPGMEAVATQRLAHVLFQEKVPIIPRMWTELAHSRTGIDIHPGAVIGSGFFIDHGTGVVIGETTRIGKNVTLYQGVTLGAHTPVKGQELRLVKRHPSIGDNVVIYAGATILGGETVVGEGSTIGGSVWLTESVPPHTRVMVVKDDLVFK
ncbi:MAG: serine acetyltransferase [Planctomycetota bacterium]|jgi:serine O-acetyltransferase|nr:serine acetyltransferase [Planctomycetota bacterium]